MNRFSAIIVTALLSAATASAFTLDLPIKEINGKKYHYYKVEPKETIYHITRTLGVTRQQIVDHNPQVADGLRAGDILLFPIDKTGSETTVPVEIEETPKAEETEVPPIPEPIDWETPILADTVPHLPIQVEEPQIQQSDKDTDAMRVAVMLPFMLDKEAMTRQAENFTKFYKGFLMAVDSLSADTSLPIEIHAYDTAGSQDTLRSQLKLPEVTGADFIIAPDDSISIATIASVADRLDAMVINAFAVKNQTWQQHESLIQTNIPHDMMYRQAIDAFCKKYAQHKAVLLNATDLPSEKLTFVNALRDALIASGIPYEQIDFSGKLTAESLTDILAAAKHPLVFVPTGSSREMLMRILPAIEETAAAGSTLFGYPEWVALRGDTKERLHRVSATVYSRFSPDYDSPHAKRVADTYSRLYGEPLDKTAPVTALMGFDTAAWLLRAIDCGLTEPYQGVQNSFKLDSPADGQGMSNRALYLVTFRPDGSLEATLL